MGREIKFPKKKVSKPRAVVEIIERPAPKFDLEKQGQYSPYWREAAARAKP